MSNFDDYSRGLEDACKVICPYCSLNWEIFWHERSQYSNFPSGYSEYYHLIPEEDQDDGAYCRPCTASKIREIMPGHQKNEILS